MPCGATSLHPTDPADSGGTPTVCELPWHQEGRGRRAWLMEWPGPPEKAEEPGPAAPCLSPGAQRDSQPRSVPPPASQPCGGRGLNTPRESLGCYLGGSELGLFKSMAKVLLNKPPEAGVLSPHPSLGGEPRGGHRTRTWRLEAGASGQGGPAVGCTPLETCWGAARGFDERIRKLQESPRPNPGISWHGYGPITCGAAPL